MDTKITAGTVAGSGTDKADAGYAWMRDGSMPHTREDLIAEAVALVALLFSVAVGLVIALLPVSARAAAPVSAVSAPSLDAEAFRVVPADVRTAQFKVTAQ